MKKKKKNQYNYLGLYIYVWTNYIKSPNCCNKIPTIFKNIVISPSLSPSFSSRLSSLLDTFKHTPYSSVTGHPNQLRRLNSGELTGASLYRHRTHRKFKVIFKFRQSKCSIHVYALWSGLV